MQLKFRSLLWLGLLSASATAPAATLDWPGSGGCATTLQACIDAANSGDTIEIVTEGVINESPLINNKDLTLTRSGAAALFGPSQTINVIATLNGVDITLSNLFVEGGMNLAVGSLTATDTQSITIDGVHAGGTAAINAISIDEGAISASTYTVTVRRSLLIQGSPVGAAVFVSRPSNSVAKPVVNILNNDIRVRGSGVAANMTAYDGTLNVNGNRIGRDRQFPTGGTISAGVFVNAENGGPTPANVRATRNTIFNVDVGIFALATSASLNVTAINNTIARTNMAGISLGRDGAQTMTGRVANNLLHQANSCSLEFRSTGIAVTHDYNQYSAVGGFGYCGTTAGANDRNLLAQFRGQFDFRALNDGASQINAGNNNDQPQVVFVIVPVPLPDIDGRSGRVGGTVDIGAHEFSFDQSFEHVSTASNTLTNLTRLMTPPVQLLPSDTLTISQFGRPIDGFTPLPQGSANHLGVWFNTANNFWNIFDQNSANTMALNRRFYTLLNIDTQVSYVHTAAAGNTSANLTTLDHPQLNNQPNALPIVTQHWDPTQSGGGTYNNSSIGVWYDTSVNRWRIFNQAPTVGFAPNMPVGASFNVLIPNPLFAAGTHAFRTTPLGPAVTLLNLSHPLLNNTACAHPYVTAVYNPNNVYVPSNLLVSYNDASNNRGNWAIERGDGLQIPSGAAFHVYIDPEQSRRCSVDPLLIDGFE